MPLLTFTQVAYDPQSATGEGIGGVTVKAYPINTDGSYGSQVGGPNASGSDVGVNVTSSSAAADKGRWFLYINTATGGNSSPTGTYAIRLSYGGWVRWISAVSSLQVNMIYGPVVAGEVTVPLPDLSIPAGKIKDGAITDPKVGNRTVDDTSFTNSSTGTLQTLFNTIVNRIKAITGKSSWLTTPATTLEAAATHMADTSDPHGATITQTTMTITTATITTLNGGTAITSANIGSQSVAFATSATTASNANALGGIAAANYWHIGNDGPATGLDADTVDGSHAAAFAASGHNHSGVYATADHGHNEFAEVAEWSGNNAAGRTVYTAPTATAIASVMIWENNGSFWTAARDITGAIGPMATHFSVTTGTVSSAIGHVTVNPATLTVNNGANPGQGANLSGKSYYAIVALRTD